MELNKMSEVLTTKAVDLTKKLPPKKIILYKKR